MGPDAGKEASKLDSVLKGMKSRGSLTQSMAIYGEHESIALGSCSHQLVQSSKVDIERTSFTVDGAIPATLELEEIGGEAGQEAFSEAIREHGGGFSMLAISGGKLLAGRDILG